MADLLSARHWARAFIERWAVDGAVCVDATMGNGYDTEALCGLVGKSGRVYAFDVQPGALEATAARLKRVGFGERARLFLAGHEAMRDCVPEPVDLVVFNLGWLPGGDKRVTTMPDTTLAALNAALELLRPGGLITLCAYPGHGDGADELRLVHAWAEALPIARAQSLTTRYLNGGQNAPVLIAVAKAPK